MTSRKRRGVETGCREFYTKLLDSSMSLIYIENKFLA